MLNEDGKFLAAATIQIHTGVIGAMRVSASTLMAADGYFTAAVTTDAGGEILIPASSDGYVDRYQRAAVSGSGAFSTRLVLPDARTLNCVSGICSGDGISLSGLPEGVTASACVFDPVDDIDAFPGSFDAIDGELLVSGGFAWLGLQDAQSNALNVLPSPATMEFEFPRKAWPALKDIVTGNNRIDVPYYAFDETLGTWQHESDAILHDTAGNQLAEDDLGSVIRGKFTRGIVARGEVSHFSYWNIDWPVTELSLNRVQFRPFASNATLEGETYTGRSPGLPQTGTDSPGSGAESDGSLFCFDAPRSETDDEDIDQDGIVGEHETGELIVRANGRLYRISALELSLLTGDCGSNPSGPITRIELTDDQLLEAELCTIQGRMVDLPGTPVPGAIVSARLSVAAPECREALCVDGCTDSTSSDADGNFTLTIPVAGNTRLDGAAVVTSPPGDTASFRSGTTRIRNCPINQVVLVADSGTDVFPMQVTLAGSTLSWDPPVPASRIFVGSPELYLKWAVTGPMLPPTQYGLVPGAAIQDIPSDGNPSREAIDTGDVIRIFASGPGEGFYEKTHEGVLQAPSLQEWLPEGHLAYFISDTVDALDLSAFHARYETGSPRNQPFHPAMMVKVLLYGNSTGVFSSRKQALKPHEDVAFRVLAENNFRLTVRSVTSERFIWKSWRSCLCRW